MRQELEDALVRDFPNLYREIELDFRESPIGRGFAVEDGWEPLIRRLSEKLEPLVKNTDARVVQVKEKWGELRFKMIGTSHDDTLVASLIKEARDKSTYICERCGADGVHRHGRGWALTLCGDCAARHARARGLP